VAGRAVHPPVPVPPRPPARPARSHFFTTNGDTALAVLPFLVAPFAVPLDSAGGRFPALFLASVGAWGMWTSQFHRWAHAESPPRVVAWLQRRGLILSPRHHRRHHRPPFVANFCITTGWCNPVLTAVRFFPTLEWVVSRLTACGRGVSREAPPSRANAPEVSQVTGSSRLLPRADRSAAGRLPPPAGGGETVVVVRTAGG
jgi:hypothetical protein